MNSHPWLRFGQISTAALTLCLADVGSAQAPKFDPPVKPTVTGKFTGNGKAADLKFVIVEDHEPFGDEPAISLLFTEKDPAKLAKPSFDAMFGKLGNALKLSLNHQGDIFGCEVYHTAHEHKGFSSVGRIKTTDFKLAGGNVSGHVTTGGEDDAFGDKWEVDLNFAAPIPEKLRNKPATPPKPLAKGDDDSDDEDSDMPKPKASSGPAIFAHKLPIPKDATNVEFKELVKQISFSSPQSAPAVTKEMSASLKQQGWKDGAGSLVGKTNSILKREQGEANLTIMIQPAGTGSTVKIFTEGFDWSGADETPAPANKQATKGPAKDVEDEVDDIEAEAKKQLEDALKGLPK